MEKKVAIFLDGRNFKYATYDSLDMKVDFVKLKRYLTGNDFLVRAYYYSGVWTEESIRQYLYLKEVPLAEAATPGGDVEVEQLASGETAGLPESAGEPAVTAAADNGRLERPPLYTVDNEKFAEFMQKRDRDLKFLRFLNRNGYKVVTKPMKVYRDYTTGEVAIKADLDVELAIDMLKLADKVDKCILASGDGDFVPVVNEVAAKGVRVTVLATQSPDAAKRGYRASDELIDAADEFIDIVTIRREIERP